jgi:mono/diheme cytochrome c family protein
MPRTISLLLSCGILLATALPLAAADADNGLRLSQRWCASCHLVSREQRQGSADAPPFGEVAAMPGFNAEKLAFFLLNPHPVMPSMALTRREAEDITAYIGSLGRRL